MGSHARPRALLLLLAAAFGLGAGRPGERRRNDTPAHHAYLAALAQTYECRSPARIGRDRDGGYVICEDVAPGPACLVYSYGIGDDDSFDVGMRDRYGCEVHQFDPTIQPPSPKPSVFFHAEGWGETRTVVPRVGPVDTTPAHVQRLGHAGRRFILKGDTEGAEWKSLGAIDDATLALIDQLVLEIHWVPVSKPEKLGPYVAVLERLAQHFFLYHVHLNNCSTARNLAGGTITDAVELSYINRRRVAPKAPADAFAWRHAPGPLDRKNCPEGPDPRPAR
jgi:hypothetical protein